MKKSKLNAISNKTRIRNEEVKRIRNEKLLNEEMICSGCGRSDAPLSASHLVPASYSYKLYTDPRNIKWHCLSSGTRKGCHELYEGSIKDKRKLLDFNENMNYINEVCPEYYKLLMRNED